MKTSTLNNAETTIRGGVESLLDHLEMHNFNQGVEACINAIDEMANQLHNDGYRVRSEALRTAVKKLTGEDLE